VVVSFEEVDFDATSPGTIHLRARSKTVSYKFDVGRKEYSVRLLTAGPEGNNQGTLVVKEKRCVGVKAGPVVKPISFRRGGGTNRYSRRRRPHHHFDGAR